MADGIERLSGYGNYGVGGYVPQRKGKDEASKSEAQEQLPQNNFEQTQVDPSKVMDFLANNTVFVAQNNITKSVNSFGKDPNVAERVAGYMENFETIYAVIENEFGAELAPTVTDMVMDRLMGMVD